MCEELPIGSQSTGSEGFSGYQVLEKHSVYRQARKASQLTSVDVRSHCPRIYCIKYVVNTEEQQHNVVA